MDAHLTCTRDGAVATITLTRPEVRNAFNDQLVGELTRAAEALAADPGVRCVVLAGAGPVFCAGADLGWMSRIAGYSPDEHRRDAYATARMFAALDALPGALIGSVHGAAVGGGAGLASVCDVVVADEETVFGFTEAKLGILPAIISPYVVAKIGASAARHLFVTGARFSAAHAREIGLVHAVVPGNEREARVNQYVREVLSSGPEAVAAIKALVRQVDGRAAANVTDITTAAIADRRVSAEGQEGMRAFLEKRRPSWSEQR